jgi:excisionase family DNA binding protein
MVFELIGSGKLRSVSIGRRRLVPESAIAEFIEALEAGL